MRPVRWAGAILAAVFVTTAATGPAAAGGGHDPGVVVQDVTIAVAGQAPVTAYVVRPRHARPHSLAGVLYLHWFEPPASNQNRTEFLGEAVALAARGAVAVLPQLTFPWAADPVGDVRDRQAVEAQLAAVTAAYRALLRQPGVDPARTAVVSHDYGAMYGALLTQREPRIRAEVFMAGDATWANWFDTYWLGLPADEQAAYRRVFAGLDPVDNVSRIGAGLYLQWGGRDPFIPAGSREAFSAADPAAKVTLYDTATHELDQRAVDDRTAWLVARLHLGA